MMIRNLFPCVLPDSCAAHTMKRRDTDMNPLELTTTITALANAIACKLSVDQLNLLGVILTQLGDTIITIATQRSICENN